MPGARRPVSRSESSSPDATKVPDDILKLLSPTPFANRERDDSLRSLVSGFVAEDVSRETPSIQILQRVGDRWSSLILIILECGTFRHSELHRIIKFLCAAASAKSISQRVLTQKLRLLERDGMLSRTVWPTVPPRTEYALTPLGHQLAQWVNGLVGWCANNKAAISDAQRNYDKEHCPLGCPG